MISIRPARDSEICGSINTWAEPVSRNRPDRFLKHEREASARGGLGYFSFVNIHPYMDGNGGIVRFIILEKAVGRRKDMQDIDVHSDFKNCVVNLIGDEHVFEVASVPFQIE